MDTTIRNFDLIAENMTINELARMMKRAKEQYERAKVGTPEREIEYRAYRRIEQVWHTANNHCSRCNGTGVYAWGTITNGVPAFSGVCHKCGGNGQERIGWAIKLY